jgi:hypothetical protein
MADPSDPDFFPSRIPDPGFTSQKSIKGKLLHTTVQSWGARTCKIVGKTLISTVMCLLYDFSSLKSDVNVAS